MKTRRSSSLFAVSLVVGLAMAAPAKAVVFNIDWTGANGWTMTGMFGYDDSLIGTGPIDESEIDGLMIEVFDNGISQGSWDLNTDGVFGAFNFNFDTNSEMFLVGGLSEGPMGQDWNVSAGGVACPNPGVGFSSGTGGQAVCVNNSIVGDSILRFNASLSTLTATRKQSVPEPASFVLFAIALGGLGVLMRRRLS